MIASLTLAGLSLAFGGMSQDLRPDTDFTQCFEANRQQISCTLCPSTSSLAGLYDYTKGEWSLQFDADETGKAIASTITFIEVPKRSNPARLKAGGRIMLAGNRFETQGERVNGIQCKMTMSR